MGKIILIDNAWASEKEKRRGDKGKGQSNRRNFSFWIFEGSTPLSFIEAILTLNL